MLPSPKSKPKPKPSPSARPSTQFEAIGTHWAIDLYQPLPNAAAQALFGAIRRRVATFDRDYSRFRNDSLVTAMARQAGTYTLPSDAKPLLDLYRELYHLTAGAMTPLIGQVLAAAGYNATYSLQPGVITAPPTWDEALEYAFPRLITKQPVLLDFGAAGKGYLVDLVSDLVEQAGIGSFCVDAGGDLAHRRTNGEPLRVGLEHPGDPRQAIGVAEILNQSLCGSATNRRAWGAYHHIMHPRSLTSPRHIQALWVTAATTMLADGLATALFFTSPEHLAKRYTFEYAIMHADSSLTHSANFPAEFFTTNTRTTR